jgi:hypothetical protein
MVFDMIDSFRIWAANGVDRGRIDPTAHPAAKREGAQHDGDEGASDSDATAPDRPPGILAAAIRARESCRARQQRQFECHSQDLQMLGDDRAGAL